MFFLYSFQRNILLFLTISLFKLLPWKNFVEAVVSKEEESTNVSCSNNQKNTNHLNYDPENFSKLKLNVKELYGSRWAINQKTGIDVYHSIDITDVTLILDNQMTLRVEFNLRQKWAAPGLEFPVGLFKDDDPPNTFVSADDKVLAYMWSPDSYISTARESNMNTIGAPVSLVYIFRNRTIIYKVRMFTKVGCSSSFQWYPLDIQTCELTIESYKYHDNIAKYFWTDEKLYRPVVIQMQRLFQYDLKLPLDYDSGTIERGGRNKRYSFVRVLFTFERKLGNNIIQVYTPTILVVVLSWFSFWLGLDAIPGRISLLVTCMLTLVTMHGGIKTSIPPVHYITMMDVWMVFCMSMVFSAMCEFVVIKYLHWRYQQKEKAKEKLKEIQNQNQFITFIQQIQEQISGANKIGNATETPRIAWGKLNNAQKIAPPVADRIVISMIEAGQTGDVKTQRQNECMLEIPVDKTDKGHEKGKEKSNKETTAPIWVVVDKICRGFFPLLFCLFNIIYWPVLKSSGI